MSRFLCKKEEVGIAIFQIQVIEDAEDDPFHAGSILKNTQLTTIGCHVFVMRPSK